MIYILSNWLIVGLTSIAAGKLLTTLLTKLFFTEQAPKTDLVYLSLSGLALLSFLAGIYHLFLPVSPVFIHTVLAICLALLLVQALQQWRKPRKKAGVFALLAAALLTITGVNRVLDVSDLSFINPHHYDDGLYYRPFVNWLTHYPVVPGLGNLHFRLANNSAWHLLTAVYEETIFRGIRFNDLNGYLMALGILYGLMSLYALVIKRANTLANYARIVILFVLLYHNGDTFFTIYNYGVVTSPTPDVPAAMLTWYVFLLALQKIEQETWYRFDLDTLVIVILVCFTITVKLSAAPLALLVVFLSLSQVVERKWAPLLTVSATVLVFTAPWLVSNVLLSGYLVFPIPQLDLFAFDWKVPDPLIHYAATNVGSWAKIPGVDQHNATLAEWVPGWYERLNESGEMYVWSVVYVHALFLGLLLVNSLAKRKIPYNSPPFLLLYAVILVGTLVWFTNIPDLRFGFGFTLIAPILLAAILLKELLFDVRLLLGLGCLAYLLDNLSPGYFPMIRDPESAFHALPPSHYPVQTNTIQLDGAKLYLPRQGDQCWDAPLPCAPAHYWVEGKSVHFRGGNVASGFCVR